MHHYKWFYQGKSNKLHHQLLIQSTRNPQGKLCMTLRAGFPGKRSNGAWTFSPLSYSYQNFIPCHHVGRDLMILYVLDRAASAKVKIINSQHLRNLISLSSSCGRIGQFCNCIFPRKLFVHAASMSLSAAYKIHWSSYFRAITSIPKQIEHSSLCKDINMQKRIGCPKKMY